jgi:hypothetical protein
MIISDNIVTVLSKLPNDKLEAIKAEVLKGCGLCSEDQGQVIKLINDLISDNE